MTNSEEYYDAPQVENNSEDDEIDLMAIAKTLWAGRKTIFIALSVGAVLGLLIALLSPKEYTVSTVMVPQMNVSKTSQLSGLASLAGVDLGMAESAELSPIIYPQIVQSVPFMLELMYTPLHFSEVDKPVSYYEYYTEIKKPSVLGTIKKYTIGLPGLLLSAIRKAPEEIVLPGDISDKPISMTEQEFELKKGFSERINLSVEKKEGYLTLSVTMPEPFVTAELAQKAQNLLQHYIIAYKVEKSQAELDFIQERYDNAKREAEQHQIEYAKLSDQYKNITSNVPNVVLQKVQTRMTIANGIYQQLAGQLEQAKIQVKRDTPAFTIVEPVTVPIEKSKPKRAMILIIWVFLGGVTGVGWVYGKKILVSLKNKWEEYEDTSVNE
ncbi:MAG: hypothetical protein BGO29_00890 [Bacteroidales bacterium 36-12]|nr:MAG: hypothetical protein BGO29_00890 [Bacteroidales bacterium 36-12]